MRNNPDQPIIHTTLLRLSVQFAAQGSNCENVLDYLADTAFSPAIGDLTALAAAWATANQAAFLATLAADTSLYDITVADLVPGLSPTSTANVGTPVPGTVTGTSFPSCLGVAAEKITAIKGQHGRGKILQGPIPLSFVTTTDPEHINAAAITAYGALHASLLHPISVGGHTYKLAITTRQPTGVPIPTNAGIVVTLTQDTTIGTVKRRKLGRGQ